MQAPILASDLQTGRALRVFRTAKGGSVAVCHPLSLIGLETLFIDGDHVSGFRVSFEGVESTWDRAGDAVQAVRHCIGELQRGPSFDKLAA